MDIREQLINLIEQAHQEMVALVGGLSQDESQAVGQVDNWAPKDLVAHLLGWNNYLTDLLAAILKEDQPPIIEDQEKYNREVFSRYQQVPLADLMAAAEEIQVELISLISTINEADLVDPDRFPWREGRPLWRTIAGTGFSHPYNHMSNYFLDQGDMERAAMLEEKAALAGYELDDSNEWRGTVQYNLACYYGRIGQTDRAVPLLREAFELMPDLVPWSQQDSDLDPIRADPAFQALYQN